MTKTYFRKRVPVQAIKWTGENLMEVIDFCPMVIYLGDFLDKGRTLLIPVGGNAIKGGFTGYSIEGVRKIHVGDFIIKNADGEFSPWYGQAFREEFEEEKHD